jgi:hypothetical protein
MANDDKKFSFSINDRIIDKPDAADRGNHGRGWQPFELTVANVAEAVLDGFAFAPQFRHDHRKGPNFIRSGFLAADVDTGMTLDEARDHAFVQHHAGLIYTTASHTPQRHRFRVVFLLDESIVHARDWADAQLGLALTLASDRSVADPARLFYGYQRAEIFRIGKTMAPAVVADLIARARDAAASRAPGTGEAWSVNSVRKVAGAELVKTARGDMVRMDELGPRVPVHCPHHRDDDPSAFTVRSSRGGVIGIRCSACRATFWPSGAKDDYDFRGFDRLCDELLVQKLESQAEPEGLDRFFPPDPAILRYQQAFLPTFAYLPGITMIQSAKGSGKTEALRALLADIRADRYRPGINRKEKVRSVLLVCHRQSLTREAAAKLDLRCYLDKDGADADGGIRTFAVCLDSLPKYNESNGGKKPKPFDLVIIDESEQVLAHLRSATIEKNYGIERCFDALLYEVANAKAVVLLDADLGLVTAHAMKTMRPQDWQSRCRIIRNAPVVPVEQRTMRLHSDRKFLERQVIEAVRRGERCYVTSNSKDIVDAVHRMILNECGDGIVMRVITSDNSREEDTVRFLKDIKARILGVQVLLGSPSIGTGIDITFPGGACMVDRVFGFFSAFINTHMDIDQQLSRVRNPGAVDVWISPNTFRFTSNVDVIKDDLARAYFVKRAVRGRRPDGMVDYDHDEPLLMICAHVTALRRASMNRLEQLFVELREHNGWVVERITKGAETSPLTAAKKQLLTEHAEKLRNAPVLSDTDFMELEARKLKGASLTDDERVAFQKNDFERTVGVTFDAPLIALNRDGRLVERIGALAEILDIWAVGRDLIDAGLKPTLETKGRLASTTPAILIAQMIRAAGLTTTSGFDADAEVSTGSLGRFVAICRDNRTTIEEILGEAMRNDFESKPVSQLGRFLRRVGLLLSKAKTGKIDHHKHRYYAVTAQRRDYMIGLALSYSRVKRRKEAEQKASRLERHKSQKAAKVTKNADTDAGKPDTNIIEAIMRGEG